VHRVRNHEVDPQAFLFNSRYLEIADVAMTEFFRDLGWPYQALLEAGVDPSVKTAQLRFDRPARFDDLVDCDVVCTRVGSSSFGLTVRMVREEDLLAEVALVYVNVDAATATAQPLSHEVGVALRGVCVG